MVVGRDVPNPDGGIIPLVRANSILTGAFIEQLKERGVRFVYINERIAAEFGDYGGWQEFPAPKRKPVIPPKLHEDAIVSLKDVFDDISLGVRDIHASSAQVVTHLDNVVHQLVDSLVAEKGALVNISGLKSYDDYTYHHSLSVAVLSISLGQRLGYGQNALYSLGMSAMMHDIGKTAVPIEVTNKTGKLDANEFELMKTHALSGYEQMAKAGIGDENLWRSVLFHHEKYDGSGYPIGIRKRAIPVFSRIMAIADVYDALTSDRPYRTPVQPGEALEYIMGSAGTTFDFDIVRAFVNKIELYPVGSFVELSNGSVAAVIANDNPLRPVVRLAKNGEIWDLNRDREHLNIVVARPIVLPQS